MQLPMGADFGEAALGLAAELLAAETEEPAWQQQVGAGRWVALTLPSPARNTGLRPPAQRCPPCSCLCPQQAETVAGLDAVTAALTGLPLPADGEALHHTQMLLMLGSIADIR